MVKETSQYKACPHPDECPNGPKRESYHCAMAFSWPQILPGQSEPTEKVICTFCWQQRMAFKLFLDQQRQQQGAGIVIAQQAPPPPLSGPGNNGRG
jgi:hypothetical protein